MEVLGTYDPNPRVPIATDAAPIIDEITGVPRKPKRYKDIQLDQSRVKYWLGVGAQPSEPVERMLCLVRDGLPPPVAVPCCVESAHGWWFFLQDGLLMRRFALDWIDGAAAGNGEGSVAYADWWAGGEGGGVGYEVVIGGYGSRGITMFYFVRM
jgi:ribosomal protein S16